MRKLITNRFVITVGLVGVFVSTLHGCAAPSRVDSYPANWPAKQTGKCLDVSGNYSTAGVLSPLAATAFERHAYLEQWLFKRDQNKSATRVRIIYDEASENLQAIFYSSMGEQVAEYFEKMHCEADILTKTHQKAFHADFISGNALFTTQLFRAVNGSLILHSLIQVSEMDFIIFPGSRTEESWAMFSPAQ